MPAVAEPSEPGTVLEVPFWQKYNAHFEFPSSVVLSVLTFVTAFAVIIGVLLLALAGGADRKPVPVRMVQGSDESGEGRMGSGGLDNPLAVGDQLPKPTDAKVDLPNPALPSVQEQPNAPKLPDLTKPGALPNANATPFEQLVDQLRSGAAGAKRGNGPGAGSGTTGQPGDGPGGFGNDDTHKRSLRWSLRFKVDSGRDYVAQLAAMGAAIVLPQPPDEKDAFVFRDLKNPKGERLAEADWHKLAGQIQFIDTKADAVRGVADELRAGFQPRRFLAFFPRSLEDELARLEVGYRNRRAEDIEETVFRVSVRGGQYQLVVDSQTPKR